MTAWSSSSVERAIPSGGTIAGSVTPPPSKSLTQRYLLIALLAEGPTLIERPLRSGDTAATRAALAALGVRIEEIDGGETLRVEAGAPPADAVIQCAANGTLLRLLMGVAASRPGRWTLDGTARLRERPVGPLADALVSLGAGVRYLGRPGHAPLEVEGGRLTGGAVTVDASRSSQFVSALLLAAVGCPEPVEIAVTELVSAPYVDLTLHCLATFGARVERLPGGLRVMPTRLRGCRARVEPDASSACYPAAAAALTGGRVLLRGLGADSAQGDLRFLELLRRMGADVDRHADDVVVGGGALDAIDADLSDLPDQVPTLAALAPFARGTTRISGVPHLRLKESDRLTVMARELGRLGATVRELAGGLEVEGTWAAAAPPGDEVVADPHGDHRIAMSLALVGLRRAGVRIRDGRVVEKSYPGFWNDLDALLEGQA
jgi:3-phosphoshikimate 1-carboxyvinyltransferase